MVEAAVNPLAPKDGGHNYLIGVDGSEASELAFTVAMHGLFRAGKDCFNVCTITNSTKQDLPFIYKPEYIEEKYQAKIYSNAQSGEARFIKKEKDMEKTTKETLWMVAQAYHADIIVCGMHGRKGPKSDFTVAGSAVTFLAQQPTTVAILKDTNMQAVKDHYRFGVLFDGSVIAERALRKALTLRADHDNLTVITVLEQGIKEANIRAKIETICGSAAHDVHFMHPEASQTIKACVKNFLCAQAEDDNYVDFICIGGRGVNAHEATGGPEDFLGSVARQMISFRKLNVIFVP